MLCLAHRTLRLSVEIAHHAAHDRHMQLARCKICMRSMSSYKLVNRRLSRMSGDGPLSRVSLCVCVTVHAIRDIPIRVSLRKRNADEFISSVVWVPWCYVAARRRSCPTQLTARRLPLHSTARNATRVSHDLTTGLDLFT